MPTREFVETMLPDHPGIYTSNPDPLLEALAVIPNLLEWFDPAPKYHPQETAAEFIWRAKRRRLTAQVFTTGANASRPVASTINGQPSLSFGRDGLPLTSTGNGSLIAEDVALIGSNYTLAFGVDLSETAQGVILSNAVQNDYLSINIDSSGRTAITQIASQAFNIRPATDRRGTKFVAVLGYRQSGGNLTLRINGAQVGAASGVPVPAGSRMRIGGGGATSTQGPLFGGRLGEVMAFDADLTAAGRAADLALVEAHLRGLYGV